MLTLKSLNFSLKLQVFFCGLANCANLWPSELVLICGLANCCFYAVPINIAHLLNGGLMLYHFYLRKFSHHEATFFGGAPAFLKLSC